MPEAIRARRIAVSPEMVIEDAVLLHEEGRVLQAGPARVVLPGLDDATRSRMVDYGDRTVLPAPLNAHTHLELSHIKGRTTLGQGFTTWVVSLLGLGLQTLNGCGREHLDEAVAQLRAAGVAHAADVCSRAPEQVAAAMDEGGVGLTLLAESFGFAPLGDGASLLPPAFRNAPLELRERMAIAGHALYSTSPERMRAAKAWCNENGQAFAFHLSEHEGEVAMLLEGSGDFAQLLEARVLPKDWRAPGLRPVDYADSLGLLDQDTLAVHCVQVSRDEVRLLAERGVTVCLCPRSNAAIGVGTAPVGEFRKAGVRLCLGTDSLGSNADLDIWQELRHILRILQEGGERPLGLGEAVALLATNAARVLGLQELGTLEPGRRAAWALLPPDLETSCGFLEHPA